MFGCRVHLVCIFLSTWAHIVVACLNMQLWAATAPTFASFLAHVAQLASCTNTVPSVVVSVRQVGRFQILTLQVLTRKYWVCTCHMWTAQEPALTMAVCAPCRTHPAKQP